MLVLYTLSDMGGECSLQTICSFSGLAKQTVNSALRKLEKEEVVILKQQNGRNKNVELTDKGMELAENTVAKIMKIENEIMESWTKEEVQQYLSLTERYLNMLKEKLEEM